MSNPLDDNFCGHCGIKLPAFGSKLGYCEKCAKRYRRVVDPVGASSAANEPSSERSIADDFGKDPLLAGVLSGVFPGGGQVYNGHFLKGLLVLCTSPLVIPWLIGIVDAFFSARRHNRQRVARFDGMAQPV